MYTGPKLTNSDLVFGYDTGYGVANIGTPTIHFKGKPTTNLTTSTLTSVFSSWAGLVGTSTTYTDGYLGGSGVRVAITTGGGVNWWSSPSLTGLSGNTQYTVSATMKFSGRAFTGNDPNILYIREYNSSNNQLRELGYFSSNRMIHLGDGWYRIWGTVTTQATTNRILLHGYSYDTNTYIHLQDLQFELGDTASPFAGYNSSRSSTDGLIDLKKSASLNLSNVSFDSTGQPDFDGTDDTISVPYSSVLDTPLGATYELIINPTGQGEILSRGLSDSGSSPDNPRIYWGTNGSIYFDWSIQGQDTYVVTSAGDCPANQFSYVVCTALPGQQLRVYVNGVEATYTTNVQTLPSSGVPNTNHPIVIGGATWIPRYFAGNIPVVKLHKRALSLSEIKENFNAYKNRFNI